MRRDVTFGGIARLVLPEVSEVFILEPGHVGGVVFVVLLLRPVRHVCRFLCGLM